MPDTLPVPPGFLEILIAHLPYALGDRIAADDDLAALGLDSMGVVQLVTDLEETFAFELPDELLTEDTFATAGSLWAAVAEFVAPEPADV
ncbi:phosphopantetheine-binding protein [Amycolatopsis sp. CA-128772]|uniref:phosphopantetheine-binding protein n=1 Tax=Amycolatopsis sp. CA-128772 TaxID=2073159 RepID=UPI000CD2ED91|nr:phosphopantetheine-binding protein [Amycolatopsis sp. CA-128772]